MSAWDKKGMAELCEISDREWDFMAKQLVNSPLKKLLDGNFSLYKTFFFL